MRLLYNCSSLEQWDRHKPHDTGIQRVVRELGRALCELSAEVTPVVFDPDGRCFRIPFDRGAKRGDEVGVGRGDLIFSAGHDWDCPDSFESLCRHADSGAHLVAVLYDTMPITFPFTYSEEFSARFRKWLKGVLGQADFCVAISDSTLHDVQAYAAATGSPCPPIHLLRLGDNIPIDVAAVPVEMAEKISRPYILAVGTIEFRKNYSVLLNAYRMLLSEMQFAPPMLYIVGGQGLLDGGIREQAAGDPRLAGRVEVLSGLGDSALNALYQNAMFTLYPSIYEGWGLPVAESLCYGKQCITSRCSSMLEIAPELTRFAHPLCPDQWAVQIRELCGNPDLLETENRKIRSEYRPVTWLESARNLLGVLEQRAWPAQRGVAA